MRAFIAIKVPENEKIGRLIADLKKVGGLKTVEPGKIHVTLKFLGEISEKQASEIGAFLETLKGFGSFAINVKGVGAFPDEREPRVIWAGVESEKLPALNELVENGMSELGFARERRTYSPHITLARVKSRVGGGLKGILTDDEFFSFDAASVSLVKSEPTANGRAYSCLKTVEL